MVNKLMQITLVLLFLLTPAFVSLLVTGAAWKVSPGRRTGWWWTPGALIALISVGVGLEAYLDHAADVTSARALGGAVIAGFVTALPLSVYYAIGRLVRSLSTVVVTWIASLMLLYPYAWTVSVCVANQTQCPPANSGCLFG